MDLKHKTITIQVIRHGETGLLVALSDDLKGLYVHARTQDDLLDRIPVAIRDILEADGFEVVDISEIDIPPEVEAGFLPAQRKFAAKVGERSVDEAIKPCPFCGSDDLVPSFHTIAADSKEMLVCVACDACDSEGPTVRFLSSDPNRRSAITKAHAAWNRRK